MNNNYLNTYKLEIPPFNAYKFYIKRDDLNFDPLISGNKVYKLKYNLLEAKKNKMTHLLSFGGAYSNHLMALAFFGKKHNFKTIGVIRGEELISEKQNKTLNKLKEFNMQLVFVSREMYRDKGVDWHLELGFSKSNVYIIPEGGANKNGIKGCMEIFFNENKHYDIFCVAVGTGSTISGIINATNKQQLVYGFSALKNANVEQYISQNTTKNNWKVFNDSRFGGFAKVNNELIQFINDFYNETKIPLDPIYTGKMLFRLKKLIKNNYFSRKKNIVVYHSGGLQGIVGINQKLKNKINYDI